MAKKPESRAIIIKDYRIPHAGILPESEGHSPEYGPGWEVREPYRVISGRVQFDFEEVRNRDELTQDIEETESREAHSFLPSSASPPKDGMAIIFLIYGNSDD